MRYYEIVDPVDPENDDWRPSIKIISEGYILSMYFPYWSKKMEEAGKESMISEDRCLNDFEVVHWANYIGDF